MNNNLPDKKLVLPNLLLISGNGRNVGKTTLACKIISYLADKTEITGLKISPHFHQYKPADVVFKNENLVVLEEKQINQKDSSLMLQAGAKKVFFIMVHPENLETEIQNLKEILSDGIIICESGGLNDFVKPGVFLLVNKDNKRITKTHYLNFNPLIVNNDGKNFDLDLNRIDISNKKITLKN